MTTDSIATSRAGPTTIAEPIVRPQRPPRESKPRLTHFLALPIGHHPALCERLTAFTSALLAADPAIPGLDATIVVPARRLHFTLGVLSLDADTLRAAAGLLASLRPQLMGALGGEPLRARLDAMDVMRPAKGEAQQAHVMWVGPARDGESARRMAAVGEVVTKAFKDAGLLVDEGRPLKLHCTVLNTIYRKPRTKGRQPFSYASILASEAARTTITQETTAAEATRPEQAAGDGAVGEREGGARPRGPASADLGEWAIDELQICEMGSHGPEGEYVAVGSISLR